MKLRICAKCSDAFTATLVDDKGESHEYDGCVPSWMPGEHYGDYVILNIDPATGQILNWKKPSSAVLKKTFAV